LHNNNNYNNTEPFNSLNLAVCIDNGYEAKGKFTSVKILLITSQTLLKIWHINSRAWGTVGSTV